MASGHLLISPRIGNSTPTEIIYCQDQKPFSNIRKRRGGAIKAGPHIAVNVGSTYYANGKPRAQGGSGVYFGPWSRHNFSEALDEDGPQTNQRGEINAAIIALDKVKELMDQEKLDTELVLLVSDSQYMVDAITWHIYKWQDKGWRNARGSEVVNNEDFSELNELIDELEDNHKVFVKFWWVAQQDNDDGDEMARQAAGFYERSDNGSG